MIKECLYYLRSLPNEEVENILKELVVLNYSADNTVTYFERIINEYHGGDMYVLSYLNESTYRIGVKHRIAVAYIGYSHGHVEVTSGGYENGYFLQVVKRRSDGSGTDLSYDSHLLIELIEIIKKHKKGRFLH